MIRRNALATIAALAALVMVAGTSHATTQITRDCIRKARNTLSKVCRPSCLSDFRTSQAQCFGPGLGCATICQNNNDGCRSPIDAQKGVCLRGQHIEGQPLISGCTDKLNAALDACRADPTDTQAQIDACANQARLDNLQCTLDCTAAVDELYLSCNQTFAQCLAGCASCATPGQCPAQ